MKTLRDIQEQDTLIEAIMESGDIGTLCCNGRTIYYANLQPLHLGITLEGTSKLDVAYKLLAHSNHP